MNLEEINKIDIRLEEMRKDYPKASQVMKKYYIKRANQLKEKRERLLHETV